MDSGDIRDALERTSASAEAMRAAYQNLTKESIAQNVVVLGGVGFAINEQFPPLLIIAACAGMALLCVNWANQLRGHSRALAEKYRVMWELEQMMSVQAIAQEWKAMRVRRTLTFERSMPWLFGLAYLMLIAMMVPWPSSLPKPDWWPLFDLTTFAR